MVKKEKDVFSSVRYMRARNAIKNAATVFLSIKYYEKHLAK